MLMALVESDGSSEYDRYEEVLQRRRYEENNQPRTDRTQPDANLQRENTKSICRCLRTADVFTQRKKKKTMLAS